MQLNETEKMALQFNKMMRERFGEKVDDFVIENVIDDPNYRTFSVKFRAYDYFPVRLNYDKGRFGCCICFGEYSIYLNNSQKWWDVADFVVFFDELEHELELRIPDKFLKEKGWL